MSRIKNLISQLSGFKAFLVYKQQAWNDVLVWGQRVQRFFSYDKIVIEFFVFKVYLFSLLHVHLHLAMIT